MQKRVLTNFHGMTETQQRDDGLGQETREGYSSTPQVVLNANAVDGTLVKREGMSKTHSLQKPHSLYATEDGSLMLVAAEGSLWRLTHDAKEHLADIHGPRNAPLAYAEAMGRVYVSNEFWQACLRRDTLEVESWGITIPDAPAMIAAPNGGLRAGTYMVAYTFERSGRRGGNSPVMPIEVSTGNGQITLFGRPEGATVWATEADGSVLYRIGEVDAIVNIPTVEPLLPMWLRGPEAFTSLCWAHGRLWGAKDSKVYWSEPFAPENFGTTSWFEVGEPVTMLAGVTGGLLVGTASQVLLYQGANPEQMQPRVVVADGALPGSLYYDRALGKTDLGARVPIWVGGTGIYAASEAGQVVDLTKDKLRFRFQVRGAIVTFKRSGYFQLLSSIYAGDDGIVLTDSIAVEVVRNGKVIN